MYLLVAILLIALESTFEGLGIRKHKALAGRIEFVFLAILILGFYEWMAGFQFPFDVPEIPFWKVITGYLLLRFAIFDLLHNIAAGLSLGYVGTTKIFDRVLNWIIEKGKVQMGLIMFVRAICGAVGIAFLLNIGGNG